MCLKNVIFTADCSQRVGKTIKLYGYKAMFRDENNLSGTDFLKDVKKNTWMTANCPIISADCGRNYIGGFHLFLNAKHASAYGGNVVVKFEIRNILGFGKNLSGNKFENCIIAEKMRYIGIVGEKGIS